MSAASYMTTTSVEKFLKQAKVDKIRHMSMVEEKIKAEPAVISEKKKKFLEKQAKMQEYAMELWEKKKKEQPTLASPIKKQIVKKLRKVNWNEQRHINEEKITDDKGKEIIFKRPDGDKLPKTQIKSFAFENQEETEEIYMK